MGRSTRHGLPTATTLAGTSFVTTLPAPITVLSPMVTPGRTITPAPSHHFFQHLLSFGVFRRAGVVVVVQTFHTAFLFPHNGIIGRVIDLLDYELHFQSPFLCPLFSARIKPLPPLIIAGKYIFVNVFLLSTARFLSSENQAFFACFSCKAS